MSGVSELNLSKKNVVYVGGLHNELTKDIIHAHFIPFGPISNIVLPVDEKTNQHKRFCFIEYEEHDDAKEAIDNMNNNELFGLVIRCNIADGNGNKGKAVWDIDTMNFETEQAHNVLDIDNNTMGMSDDKTSH